MYDANEASLKNIVIDTVPENTHIITIIINSIITLPVLQKACMCSPASGTTVQTIVSMAATVYRLNKKVSSFSMVTGEFTMMTSSQRFELSMRPSKR